MIRVLMNPTRLSKFQRLSSQSRGQRRLVRSAARKSMQNRVRRTNTAQAEKNINSQCRAKEKNSKNHFTKEITKRSQRGDMEYTSCRARYNEGREVEISTNISPTITARMRIAAEETHRTRRVKNCKNRQKSAKIDEKSEQKRRSP